MIWRSVSELAAACRNGDADAWEALLGRYERLVYTIAYREGLSSDDAADVTQATFTALVAQLDHIKYDDQIPAWLMTVARRQSWRVRAERQRQVPDPEPALEGAASAPGADLDTRLWLYDGLLALDEPCRRLVLALYFEPDPPSYAELANELGRPVGSIGPVRARCLERLRKILENLL